MPWLQGCSLFGSKKDDHGEFRAIKVLKWEMQAPEGMVRIPSGSFMMGAMEPSIFHRDAPNKTVSVSSFFMDDTEVTNGKYKFFLDKVKEIFANIQAQSNNGTTLDEGKGESPDPLTSQLTDEFIKNILTPDEKVWCSDFKHNMSDTVLEQYFSSDRYQDYPVVGISWEAAKCFTAWRTKYLNDYREGKGLEAYPSFSLPSAAQWEYAARGGKAMSTYPWGSASLYDQEGKVRANFKTEPGNYAAKKSTIIYTTPVDFFAPNDFGLHDMAGNVAEWTLDAYNPESITLIQDFDPVYLDENQPLKITKGGSWKDTYHFLQAGSFDCEHKDSVRSYIGFRCVMPCR
eukprot:gene273-358_t